MNKLQAHMIPFVDLKIQYEHHRESFEKAFSDVCESGGYILGPEVARFEKNFAEYVGAREAIGMATGTDALRLSCKALGIVKGDEVLVPANTFIASALGIYELGAVPVPVDVNPETYLMDLKDATNRLSGRTKGILPVHLYGQSLDMDALVEFARKYNLFIIEDACQAHGARWKGRRVGSFGISGCFSFYPSKNLGAFGDGGAVTTNDPLFADKLRMMRNYGSKKKYIHDEFGTNSRLDSIQAAILNIKLGFLDEWNDKRFQVACRYADGLQGINGVTAPFFDRGDKSRHVFHLFVIQSDRRDELQSYLEKQEVQCGIHYPVPIHLHKAFESLGFKKGTCPVAERLSDKILSLPIFPEMSDQQIDAVVNTIKRFFK